MKLPNWLHPPKRSDIKWILQWLGIGCAVFITAFFASSFLATKMPPWVLIIFGFGVILLLFGWSQYLYEREMRKKKEENYCTYNLQEGYTIPTDYNVKKIDEHLGIGTKQT
jgi:amino acid transporter